MMSGRRAAIKKGGVEWWSDGVMMGKWVGGLGFEVFGFPGDRRGWFGGLEERKRCAAIGTDRTGAVAGVIDGRREAASWALGDETLANRGKDAVTAVTEIVNALVARQRLRGAAELAVIKESAWGIEAVAAEFTRGLGTPAVGEKRREIGATVVAVLGEGSG